MPDAGLVATKVEAWFMKEQRPLPWRATYDPYLVWVSEVMLQQTRMEVVLRYYPAFINRFPSIGALAAASEDEVLAAWSGLGYYRRARMLRQGAVDVMNRFAGRLPAERETLQTIHGIGRYTAGAVASIAFDQTAPIVDGNVARVLARITGDSDSAALWKESERLVHKAQSPRMFNQGLMELGATVCKPQNPDCTSCPVRRHCYASRNDCVATLPAPKKAAKPRALTIPLYAIADRHGRILMRRERGKLMTSMLHLPHGNRDLLSAPLIRVVGKRHLGTFRHTVTTRRIRFEVFAARLRGAISDSTDYVWVSPGDLRGIPHPSYVAKAMALIPLQSPSCAGG